MDVITNLISALLQGITQGFTGALQSLMTLVGTTPPEFTFGNALVVTAHNTMLAAADLFLGLLVIGGGIQMLHGQATGSLYLPPRAFIPRFVGIVLVMHLSALFTQDLILLNNELCAVLHASVPAFIQQVNNGQQFNGQQQVLLGAIFGALFMFAIIRIIFQAIDRIVWINVQFALVPFYALLLFLPQTQQIASMLWRTLIITIFTQFVQVLAITLAFQFLIDTKFGGPTAFVLGIGLMFFVGKIPGLLARFGSVSGSTVGGAGTLIRSAITASVLLA